MTSCSLNNMFYIQILRKLYSTVKKIMWRQITSWFNGRTMHILKVTSSFFKKKKIANWFLIIKRRIDMYVYIGEHARTQVNFKINLYWETNINDIIFSILPLNFIRFESMNLINIGKLNNWFMFIWLIWFIKIN